MRFKEKISTTIGLVLCLFSIALLFIETNYDLPLWGIGLIFVVGVLLINAKDKVVDIFTLGLSRFVKDVTSKK